MREAVLCLLVVAVFRKRNLTEKRRSRKKERNAKQQPEHLETSKRGSCSGAREKHVQLGEAGARRCAGLTGF